MSVLDLKKDINEALQIQSEIDNFGKKSKVTDNDKKEYLNKWKRYKEITGVEPGPYQVMIMKMLVKFFETYKK